MSAEPGTWRVSDGSTVPMTTAKIAWADAAIPVLQEAGRNFGTIVRYKELGEAVQASTGIRTKMLLTHWIGGVLRAITDRPYDPGEPMLSSLVVDAAGHVGLGYADAVVAREGTAPPDPDEHAADQRLRCYRYLGADVPSDARPQLPPDLLLRRRKEVARRRSAAPRPKCPRCGGWKPSGLDLCDNCLTG